MAKDCIFCKIAKHEIPKEFIFETEDVMVFSDIHPVAPVHLLLVPKKHITEFTRIGKSDKKIWEEMVEILRELIKKYKLTKKGYRVVTNGGGAQLIDHFHVHLMGGISQKKKF